MRIIATVGLPASGKSTWAKQWCKDNPGWVRICDEDISREQYGVPWSAETAPFVQQYRNRLVRDELQSGKNVVLDNCHLSDIAQRAVPALAAHLGAELEWRFFRNVSVEECIRRDAARLHPVGARLIRQMARNKWKP